MTTIPKNTELLKNLFELLAKQREVSDQQRVRERVELLVLAELFTCTLGLLSEQSVE
ncbi:MAG: hypothetical protein Kow00106_23580 [Anaerolineae bacterium]